MLYLNDGINCSLKFAKNLKNVKYLLHFHFLIHSQMPMYECL